MRSAANGRCPCCGQTLPDAGIVIDVDKRIANVAGQAIKLTRAETAILHLLVKRAPAVVHYETLRMVLYGATNGPQFEHNALKAHIHCIRRKLAPVKFKIIASYGTGFYLEAQP